MFGISRHSNSTFDLWACHLHIIFIQHWMKCEKECFIDQAELINSFSTFFLVQRLWKVSRGMYVGVQSPLLYGLFACLTTRKNDKSLELGAVILSCTFQFAILTKLLFIYEWIFFSRVVCILLLMMMHTCHCCTSFCTKCTCNQIELDSNSKKNEKWALHWNNWLTNTGME